MPTPKGHKLGVQRKVISRNGLVMGITKERGYVTETLSCGHVLQVNGTNLKFNLDYRFCKECPPGSEPDRKPPGSRGPSHRPYGRQWMGGTRG